MSDKQLDELMKQNKTLMELYKLHQIRLNEIKLISYEIRNWHKIAYDDKVKPLLESILNEPIKIAVYHLSNGENTTRIISKKTGIGTGSVSRWWNKWIDRGIAIPIPKGTGFRAKKMFELEDYNIRIPDVSNRNKTQDVKDQEE